MLPAFTESGDIFAGTALLASLRVGHVYQPIQNFDEPLVGQTMLSIQEHPFVRTRDSCAVLSTGTFQIMPLILLQSDYCGESCACADFPYSE